MKDIILNSNNYRNMQVIEIKTERGFKLISVEVIIFIKANIKRTILKVEKENEPMNSLYPLSWYTSILKPPLFLRCHKSYIINCKYVEYYCSKAIILKGNHVIPLSRQKISDLKNNLIELQDSD